MKNDFSKEVEILDYNDVNTFGKRLTFLRKYIDLTQEEFATDVNTDRALISRYERDLDIPSPFMLKKFSSIFSEQEMIFLKSDIYVLPKKVKTNEELFDKKNFANRLVKLRQMKKLSQVDLSKLSGIYHGNIAKYERNFSIPDLMNSIRLADALGVTVDLLLRGENTNTKKRDSINSSLIQTFFNANNCNDSEKEAIIMIVDAAIKGFRK